MPSPGGLGASRCRDRSVPRLAATSGRRICQVRLLEVAPTDVGKIGLLGRRARVRMRHRLAAGTCRRRLRAMRTVRRTGSGVRAAGAGLGAHNGGRRGRGRRHGCWLGCCARCSWGPGSNWRTERCLIARGSQEPAGRWLCRGCDCAGDDGDVGRRAQAGAHTLLCCVVLVVGNLGN